MADLGCLLPRRRFWQHVPPPLRCYLPAVNTEINQHSSTGGTSMWDIHRSCSFTSTQQTVISSVKHFVVQGYTSHWRKPPVDSVQTVPAAAWLLLQLLTAKAGWRNIQNPSQLEVSTTRCVTLYPPATVIYSTHSGCRMRLVPFLIYHSQSDPL